MSSRAPQVTASTTTPQDLLEGLLELNFARTVPADASKAAAGASGSIALETDLGSYRASSILRPLDFATLSFISQKWAEQGGPGTDTKIAFSLTELARAVYPPGPDEKAGGDLGGKHRRLARESLSRLFLIEITAALKASDEHGDTVQRVRRLRVLQETDIWSEAEREEHPDLSPVEFSRRAGSRRASRDTVQIRFSSWMIEQLQAGFALSIDLDKLRRLNGTAQRLYAWLGMPPERDVPVRLRPRKAPMSPGLLATLGINRAEARECARALRDAGKRILEVDSRISRIDAVRRENGGYFLEVDFADEHREDPMAPEQLRLGVVAG